MDTTVRLAKLFKERENPFLFGALVGTVISTSPPQIKISNDIAPRGSKVIIANSYRNVMKNGDEVIVITSSDNQKYFVIDKAVRG
ncbi:DUF2577 family protein [Bacillus sp. FJAT-45350]|uniref:DUF2577 family protein n=1 Tax=Bacillus sp. FJAT-45350 TaxID=2011014 RepID=UPI000BB821D4|nr:DUF2577 family protein [Bacillus sp. FJAT-45350]